MEDRSIEQMQKICCQSIIARLNGVTPLASHPDWLCWQDLVEDVCELRATSSQQYQALFPNLGVTDSLEDFEELCSVLSQLIQTSRYTLTTGNDGLPCLGVWQNNRQAPARPVDVLYAVHHRLAVGLAQ
jgi:hypothetical protein